MKPLWLKLNYLPRGVKKILLPRCYLWSFTGGRFFGLVLLFTIASVCFWVLVCLSWFGLVCLHRTTNSARIITSNKPNRSYSSCVFWGALVTLEGSPRFFVFVVRCVNSCVFLIFLMTQPNIFIRASIRCIWLLNLCCFVCVFFFIFNDFMVVVVVVCRCCFVVVCCAKMVCVCILFVF